MTTDNECTIKRKVFIGSSKSFGLPEVLMGDIPVDDFAKTAYADAFKSIDIVQTNDNGDLTCDITIVMKDKVTEDMADAVIKKVRRFIGGLYNGGCNSWGYIIGQGFHDDVCEQWSKDSSMGDRIEGTRKYIQEWYKKEILGE